MLVGDVVSGGVFAIKVRLMEKRIVCDEKKNTGNADERMFHRQVLESVLAALQSTLAKTFVPGAYTGKI